jgi:hypothetical protein
MPSLKNINWSLIRLLADYSDRAYRESTATDAATKASALVVAHGGDIWVTFKGSSEPEDFIQDAKFELRPLGMGGMKIHRGFYEDWEALSVPVINQVQNWLGCMPEANIYVGGHSLGGGEAIPCAKDLAALKLPLKAVITFGQPRVGNAAFRDAYDLTLLPDGKFLGDITWHVVNPDDPIPLSPPLLFGYRDEGHEIYLAPAGPVADPSIGLQICDDVLGAFDSWRQRKLAFIPHHFIAAYIERMANL